MATILNYYEEEAAIAIEEEGDAEVWACTSRTDEGKLFLSITDSKTETEAGVLLTMAGASYLAEYLSIFVSACEQCGMSFESVEVEGLGESEEGE